MDTVVKLVCVPDELSVGFEASLSCFGDPVSFTPALLTPAAPADSLVEFSWDFGDPATGSNNSSALKTPAHAFSSVGYYTVSLTATDKFGCVASYFKNIQVNALPVAAFSYLPGACDSTLVFSSASIDTSSVITSFIWNFCDGQVGTLAVASASHKSAVPG